LTQRLLKTLFRNGLRRGILGGSRPWTAVAVAVGGLRLFQRLTRPGDAVVYREELRPGETVTISHLRN
jgi:hypothetical protein